MLSYSHHTHGNGGPRFIGPDVVFQDKATISRVTSAELPGRLQISTPDEVTHCGTGRLLFAVAVNKILRRDKYVSDES